MEVKLHKVVIDVKKITSGRTLELGITGIYDEGVEMHQDVFALQGDIITINVKKDESWLQKKTRQVADFLGGRTTR